MSGITLGSARLLYRSLDVVRILTIARWLGPDEMGVYAVATLIITALEQISQTGLHQALIQRQGDISSYLLPVRTIQALRGIALGLLVYVSAPVIAGFFNSPKSLEVLRIMALYPVITGFEPLAVTLWQRELQFTPMVLLNTTASIVSLLIGLVIALHRPSAWALVWASLSGVLVMTAGAHVLTRRAVLGFSLDWRPVKEISGFGFWIFMTGIVSYAFMKGGDWMIGSLLDIRTLALYQMAFLICTAATTEIGQVVTQISFPVFSLFQDDRVRLQTAFRNSFGLLSLITIGTAGLVCVCAPDGFRLVLGERWLPALQLIPWLAVWGICSMFSICIAGLFNALGKPKLWTQTVFLMAGFFVLGVYPMTRWLGGLGVAILMACIGLAMQALRYSMISRLIDLPLVKVFSHVAVPALACFGAVALTSWLRQILQGFNSLSGLFFCALCLPAVYALLLLLGHKLMDPSPLDLLRNIRSLAPGGRNDGTAVDRVSI